MSTDPPTCLNSYLITKVSPTCKYNFARSHCQNRKTATTSEVKPCSQARTILPVTVQISELDGAPLTI